MDEARRLGGLLGVIARHSMPVLQQALAACRDGVATPTQQKIVFEFIEAIGGKV